MVARAGAALGVQCEAVDGRRGDMLAHLVEVGVEDLNAGGARLPRVAALVQVLDAPLRARAATAAAPPLLHAAAHERQLGR